MVVKGGERERESKSEGLNERLMQEQDGEGSESSVACRLEIIDVRISGQSVIFRVDAEV